MANIMNNPAHLHAAFLICIQQRNHNILKMKLPSHKRTKTKNTKQKEKIFKKKKKSLSTDKQS